MPANKPQWLAACPYSVMSRELEFVGTVYVCVCLMRPDCTGIGATKAEAIQDMTDRVNELEGVERE